MYISLFIAWLIWRRLKYIHRLYISSIIVELYFPISFFAITATSLLILSIEHEYFISTSHQFDRDNFFFVKTNMLQQESRNYTKAYSGATQLGDHFTRNKKVSELL